MIHIRLLGIGIRNNKNSIDEVKKKKIISVGNEIK